MKVLQNFLQLTGKVDKVHQEPDGDYHINLRLQAPDTHYLVQNQKDLIVEVIPTDQPTVTIPQVGQTVTPEPGYTIQYTAGLKSILHGQ